MAEKKTRPRRRIEVEAPAKTSLVQEAGRGLAAFILIPLIVVIAMVVWIIRAATKPFRMTYGWLKGRTKRRETTGAE